MQSVIKGLVPSVNDPFQPYALPPMELHSTPVAMQDYLQQICPAGGHYSRGTFNTLASCLLRMVRDQNFPGLLILHAPQDESIWSLTLGLEHRHTLKLVPLLAHDETTSEAPMVETQDHAEAHVALDPQTRMLIILTNRLCGCLYWRTTERLVTPAPMSGEDVMCEGGWTFHPADSKAFAEIIAKHLHGTHPDLYGLVKETPIDRRYDERLSLLLTGLIQRLENRNLTLRQMLERERTLQKRLVEQERLAAIGHLCTAIAHEIRNPLGLVDLYAGLMEAQLEQSVQPHDTLEASLKEKLLEQVGQIRHATQHLDTILTGLTHYARPVTLAKEATCLPVLLEQLAQFMRPQFEQKGITLKTLHYASELLTVLTVPADGAKIQQALINLLKNALEATPQGKEVLLHCATRGSEDPWVYIKVTDQGHGIPAEVLPKLFTPYFTTKGSAGTGLGLAEVRKLMQAHQGKAEVLQTSPQGTTFALALPKA
ncbi:MAG: sensor histidine kinase [Vampirovibrionales bacterium]